MDTSVPIPIPPPPPATPMPEPGTEAWARWHLVHTFKPDDAAIIEWVCTWRNGYERTMNYANACHVRRWAGWQATLAKACIDAISEPLQDDDDIPF